MRNKIISRFLSVILAVGLSAAMFTTTAFAGGGDEEGEVIPTEPTGEVASTPDPKPLTPEGNMSLVDDIDGEASEDKHLSPSFPRPAIIFTLSSTGPGTARTRCIFSIRWTRPICWR